MPYGQGDALSIIYICPRSESEMSYSKKHVAAWLSYCISFIDIHAINCKINAKLCRGCTSMALCSGVVKRSQLVMLYDQCMMGRVQLGFGDVCVYVCVQGTGGHM